MKKCNKCNIEKDIESFVKYKSKSKKNVRYLYGNICKKCEYEKYKEKSKIWMKKWKNNNKKIIKSICIDCNCEYETITYNSTHIPNIRCKKCSIKNTYKNKLLSEKKCRICEVVKPISDYYPNYKMCKTCLFKKRNERYYQRLKEDHLFKIKHNIKTYIRLQLKQIDAKKNNNKTIEILGCPIHEFISHLEYKFEPWMSWENYGKYNGELNYGWDIDHIIPISSAKTEEEIYKLNHYTNLQPLCSKTNRDIKSNIV